MYGRVEYGDYQTPNDFANKICLYLKSIGINPDLIIEPTCGIGNFLSSAYEIFNAKYYYGIEINKEYSEYCKNRLNQENVFIFNENLYNVNLKKIAVNDDGASNVLLIGNPPWVNNAVISSINGVNVPNKVNFKNLYGLEAMTGSSNFDICEYMIYKMINEFKFTNTVIAMLCKMSVARNVFLELKRSNHSYKDIRIVEFNSKKIFNISVRACLLIVFLSDKEQQTDVCNIYHIENPKVVQSKLIYQNGRLYSNLDEDLLFDGKSQFEWRQGVKHDCSKVMELKKREHMYINGRNELVDIEDELVYPLVKSSMFKKPIQTSFSKYVIITQKKCRDDTSYIKEYAPKTWSYLNDNIKLFENRKSSIYKGTPKFSIFGIGDYSFSKYKVGISGFYKKPFFSLLTSDKPVMCDDTSYFITFSSFDLAYTAMLLLNSKQVQTFLLSIAFLDSKRPFTKKVLERLDFSKITKIITIQDLKETEEYLQLEPYIKDTMYAYFKNILNPSLF